MLADSKFKAAPNGKNTKLTLTTAYCTHWPAVPQLGELGERQQAPSTVPDKGSDPGSIQGFS